MMLSKSPAKASVREITAWSISSAASLKRAIATLSGEGSMNPGTSSNRHTRCHMSTITAMKTIECMLFVMLLNFFVN